MNQKKLMKPEKKPKNYRRVVFLAISIAFTGISLYNGYGFYESMYGVYIAALISVSIEISSLAFFFHVLYNSFRRSHVIIIILIIIFIHARMQDTTAIDRIIEERRATIADLQSELQAIYEITPEKCRSLLHVQDFEYFCFEFFDKYGNFLPLNLDEKRPLRCSECIEVERIAYLIGFNLYNDEK